MLPHDFDLTSARLQALSSREAIVACFAQLGYNTEARLKQTSAALGFSDVLAHEVTHVERVADHENGELQVYLLEMKHVTVALTQALARSLRNRAGNFLLVLTADYERIDFVLMDLVRPEGSAGGIGLKAAFLRPRTLTLERRNPSLVDVRVLRRFSYTESDVYYQLDKIRSAYGVAEWSEPFFNNRALFSDYYLNERLPQLPEWQADAAPAFRALSKLLADAREKFAGKREAELRTQLYQPLFAALGWKAEAQKAGHEDDARADYVLSDASRSRVPCLTYVWDRYLDGPDETRDNETPRENPAQTVVGLLDHGQAGGWAIVTNGKVWRLYSARAHSRATNYYEIDLEETLASPDVDVAFRYFWLFFRPHPPTPSPEMKKHISGEGERPASPRQTTAVSSSGEGPGVRFLDFLLDESASFAKALGERLKDRVFGEVFPYFAEGFIKHGHPHPERSSGRSSTSLRSAQNAPATESKDAWTDDDLVVAFQATLTFLYRLLFVLYAEARDLLPVRETRGYWEVSLQRIKEEIAAKAGTLEDEVADRLEKAYSAGETTLYDRLLKLFRVIDRGAAELNVPIYNGGLFQTDLSGAADQSGLEIARFLQSHKIPDRYLALGLDRMARDIDARRGDLVAIDYKSLGVRHLGSIYEGLLEFRLRIAREKMAVVRGKKTDEVVAAREAKDAKIKATLPKGAAYLENDKHERKATGSYYTPDYIVKYIVQHTVGPVLDEKFEALRPRLRQAAKRFDETVKRKQTIEKAPSLDRPALLNDVAGDLLRDLFDVKVLDPAMGSGHFLVEAVDFITDRLLRFLYGFPFVNHFFEGQRSLILSALQRQGVTVDPARLTDVNLLKRHVLKRCIFGVDLNRMAVELAKVSVWLDCFTLGAPLSFLDHHLKWGNSLIGTTAREADYELQGGKSQQMTFLTGPFVGLLRSAEIMRGISTLGDATVEQVHESASLFKQFEDAAKPYKQLLDVFVSRNLGIKHADEFLQLYGAEVMTADPSNLGKDHRKVLVERTRLFDKHRFFHWDLEFPEVFIDLEKADWQANAGFDAVIGNPPYANAWLMTADDSETRLAIDTTVNTTGLLEGHWDLFAAFIVRALQVARHGGWHSFIVPDALLREKYALALRKHLLTDLSIERVMHFEGTNVFDEVSRHCVVYAITTTASEVAHQTVIEAPVSETSLSTVIVGHVPQNEWLQAEGAQIRVELAVPIKRQISRKVFANSLRVGQFCYVMVGATTHSKDGVSFKKADIISWEPIGNAQRFFDGKTLSRYEIEWDGRYIDYRQKEMYGPRYPELFESEKVVVRDVTGENEQLIVSFDSTKSYCDHLVTCVVYYESMEGTGAELNFEAHPRIAPPYPSLEYLTAILASKLMTFIFRLHFATGTLQGDYSHTYPQQVRALPIRRIDFTTPAKRRTELMTQAKDLSSRQDQPGLLAFVEQRLAAQPEESDVVHDVLAFLAEQMIDLNKRKQAEMKRLLTWLESALKISPDKNGNTGLDVLTGKSRLRNYLGDYQKGEGELAFEEVVDILHKNRTRIGISLSEARIMARLRTEYEQSVETLKPLKAQLAWTDGVIDQIVYRLYGLGVEEIRVVEGVNE